ncbi:MAG TPA: hypothetical protein VFZ61_27145, partial [Polyangiales bacterium]
GREIMVEPVYPHAMPPVGRAVVVPVRAEDAGASVLKAAILAQDGSFVCSSGSLTLGPMTRQQLTTALLSGDCKQQLGMFNPKWDDQVGDGGAMTCATRQLSPGATADPGTLGILLALAALIVRRRRAG